MKRPRTVADSVAAVLRDMEDAGALIKPHESAPGLAPGFIYEMSAGGDRAKCRQIIASAKSDTAIWAELVAEIHRRARGTAA